MIRPRASRTEIESNETVVLYPTFANYDAGKRAWQVRVHGCVHEPGRNTLRRRVLLKLLQKAMRARPEDLESDIFKRRIHGFLQTSERGKRISLRIGPRLHVLKKKSRRNGHFGGILQISDSDIDRLRADGQMRDEWLQFEVVSGNGDQRTFPGRVRLMPPSGLSVISDVDDTIKHSNVGRRSDMLANTFLRDHQSVAGMSELFDGWHGQDAVFHYVSSTPWQLYDCLQELCSEHGFPEGTFHLRMLRLRDPTVLRLFIARRWGKRLAIGRILKAFPDRRFLLLGDSGEKDPEIYGAMARKFPDRVERILIRDLSPRRLDPMRYQKAFRDMPRKTWVVFNDPGRLIETAGRENLCLGH
jgi:hypothetical protein